MHKNTFSSASRVSYNFPNEGELSLRDLVPNGRDVKKSRPKGIVHVAILNHLSYCVFEDLPHISMEEDF